MTNMVARYAGPLLLIRLYVVVSCLGEYLAIIPALTAAQV